MNNLNRNQPTKLTFLHYLIQCNPMLNIAIGICFILIMMFVFNEILLPISLILFIQLGLVFCSLIVPKQVQEILIQTGYIWNDTEGYYIKDGSKFKIDDWNIYEDKITITLKNYSHSFITI